VTLVKPLIDEVSRRNSSHLVGAWRWSRGLHLVARRRRMPPNSEVKESTSPGWVGEQVPGPPFGQVAEKVCPYGGCAPTGIRRQYRATGGPVRESAPASHVVAEMEQVRRPDGHERQGIVRTTNGHRWCRACQASPAGETHGERREPDGPEVTASSETTWRRARCPVGDIGSTGLSGPWCRPRP